MKNIRTTLLGSFVLGLVVAFGATGAQAQSAPSCEDFRCSFQARVDADCPCTGMGNHGRYVSCVAHVINDLVKEGLPTNCKGQLKRCAARSTCGKEAQGFVTCTTVQYGACVTNADQTTTCDNDPTVACTVDTDCVVSSQCRLTRDAAGCEAAGGAVNLSPSCCSTCNTTP